MSADRPDYSRLRDPEWIELGREIFSGAPGTRVSIKRSSMLAILDELVRLRQLTEHMEVTSKLVAVKKPTGGSHFKRIRCEVCGVEISSAGFARRPHENGRVHQAALAGVTHG